MTRRIWHSGPPPHIGWWNASRGRVNESWRWWNGSNWSFVLAPDATRTEVEYSSAKTAPFEHLIEWTDYWPKNARVPRIDPRSTT